MKYLIYIVIFLALIGIFHFVVQSRLNSNPPFVTEKLDNLLANKKLMDSIGGSPIYEFSYNENDYQLKDTMEYSIKIKGARKVLNYEATQVKQRDGSWTQLKEILDIK